MTHSKIAALSTHLGFVALICLVSLIRWRLLRDTPYPTGLDGGNWLAFGHTIFGEHIRSPGLVYPPVVPLLAVASERLLGTYEGLKILAFVSAAAPATGFYVLFYAWGLRWRAAVLAGFLAASAATGDPMAWGGYPQLIGLGLLPVFVLALDRFLTSRSIVDAVPPALLLSAAFATSDLVGPFTAIVGIVYMIARYTMLAMRHKGNSARNVALGLGLSVLFAMPVAPTYLALLPGLTVTEHSKMGSQASMLDAVSAFNGITSDLPLFWAVGFVLALLTPLALATRQHRLALLCIAVLVPSVALLVWIGENRFAYFVPLGIVVGLAAWWGQSPRLPAWSRRTLDAAVVTFLAIDVLIGTQYFASERNYYTVLTPGLVQGLSELQSRSTASQIIAVSPAAHDWELGWWVEGAVRRRTVYAGNPIWLTYSDERARNAVANHIYAQDANVAESVRRARDSGVAYLFVDKDWEGYMAWNRNGRDINSSTIVYENASVLIIATNG